MITYIAAFLSGLLGSMGFGGGSVLIIYLTLFADINQLTAQGINLLFFIPCAVLSVVINVKNKLVKYKVGVYLILGGLIGVAVGSLVVKLTEPTLLSKLFGGFIFIIGLITLFQKPKKSDKAEKG